VSETVAASGGHGKPPGEIHKKREGIKWSLTIAVAQQQQQQQQVAVQ
jgi:hypothetical protein